MFRLIDRGLSLREINETDIEQLFEWRNSSDFIVFCTRRDILESFGDFKDELIRDLNTDRHLQCIIEEKDISVGTIYVYSLDKENGNCFITTFIQRKSQNRGLGIRAFVLLARHMFDEFELYKIYVDVYEFNSQSLKYFRRYAELEGKFKGHRLIQNKRVDIYRFAIYGV